jgi:hypothetical protein
MMKTKNNKMKTINHDINVNSKDEYKIKSNDKNNTMNTIA